MPLLCLLIKECWYFWARRLWYYSTLWAVYPERIRRTRLYRISLL